MSIENWQPHSELWSAVPESVPADASTPSANANAGPVTPTQLARDLSALTRVLLGVAPSRPADLAVVPALQTQSVVAVAAPAPVPAFRPEATGLAPTMEAEPVAVDDHRRLRSMLAELSFLDD